MEQWDWSVSIDFRWFWSVLHYLTMFWKWHESLWLIPFRSLSNGRLSLSHTLTHMYTQSSCTLTHIHLPPTPLQWWADTGRNQAVLCCCGEGGVEVWHVMWPLRHAHNHTGSHLLQYQAESGVADREDARGQFHRLLHARRHAAEGARRHHEGVPCWRQVGMGSMTSRVSLVG